MEMNKSPIYKGLRLLLIFVCVCVSIIIAWRVSTELHHRGLVKITVQTIPNDSLLSLDGKTVNAGAIYLKPGTHTLKAARQYFDTVTEQVNTKNTSPSEVIYLLPIPSSPSAIGWLDQHPDIQLQREAQGGLASEILQNQINKQVPFIKQLPLVYGDGQGGIVNISPGVPLHPGGPPAVYVTAATPAIRQDVLTYMRSRGYDPADMDIVFYGQSNPLDTSGD